MERFVLKQNIARFEETPAQTENESRRGYFTVLLYEWRRRLALLEADMFGSYLYAMPADPTFNSGRLATEFRNLLEKQQTPSLLLHPGAGLHILDMNDAYARATMTGTTKVGGAKLFDAFPDNPEDTGADGVVNLFYSLQIAARTGKRHEMAVQRYDVRDEQNRFQRRYWKPVNTPITNGKGHLIYLLHQVEDITAQVMKSKTN